MRSQTRKTWKFNDIGKDRVQVALESEGRPCRRHPALDRPDWTPFSLKACSEDGKARLIKTLVGTRNKQAMIEVQNKGEQDFPINAASGYASESMAKLPIEITQMTDGVRIDGNALRSWPISEGAKQVEVVLHTDGRQLNAKIELLNAPNNPKQVYEVFTNNGDLNRLVVCFDVPEGATRSAWSTSRWSSSRATRTSTSRVDRPTTPRAPAVEWRRTAPPPQPETSARLALQPCATAPGASVAAVDNRGEMTGTPARVPTTRSRVTGEN